MRMIHDIRRREFDQARYDCIYVGKKYLFDYKAMGVFLNLHEIKILNFVGVKHKM